MYMHILCALLFCKFLFELRMEKILVKWCDGRSMGMTSLKKSSAVKAGTIAIGDNSSHAGEDKESIQC